MNCQGWKNPILPNVIGGMMVKTKTRDGQLIDDSLEF